MSRFVNALIELSDIERGRRVLYGRIKATVSYGRPGRLRHSAEKQLYLALKFDRDGNFENAEVSETEFSKEDAAQSTQPQISYPKRIEAHNKKSSRKGSPGDLVG